MIAITRQIAFVDLARRYESIVFFVHELYFVIDNRKLEQRDQIIFHELRRY